MAAPTLVGVTRIDPAVSWQSAGHTISTVTLPAGTRLRDRLVLYFVGGHSNYSSNQPYRWGLPTEHWTLQRIRGAPSSGYGPFIACWTARYTSSAVMAATLVPRRVDDTPILSTLAADNWQAFLLAYRPSHVVGSSAETQSYSADHLLPGSPPATPLTITNPVDGINIACATFASPGPTCRFNGATGGGYTEIANYAPVPSGALRRQGVSLVDRDAGSTNIGNLQWEKDPFSFGFTGVAVMLALTETADRGADTSWSLGLVSKS